MIKTVSRNNFKKIFSVGLAALIFAVGGFFVERSAFAAVAVTPALGGSAISADSAGGNYAALIGPVISESASGDIGKGTVILNAPSGFVFDTGGTAPTIRVDCTGGCLSHTHNINNTTSGNSVPISSITATQITKNITQTTDNGVTNSLTWQNVRVRPANGTPLALGNITESGTSVILGVNGTTNFGTLNEVAGTATQIRVETAANGSGIVIPTQTIDADHSVTAYSITRDQFNNFLANAAAAWSLITKTGGVLDADFAAAGDQKSAVFSGNVIGTAVLHAASGALTTHDSGTITVIAGSLASIVVSPDAATIDADHTQTFTVEGFDSSRNSLGDVTSATAFNIAEAPVDGGNFSGAVYHPHAAGAYHARGTDGAFTETTASLTVTPGAASASQSTVSANPETQTADGTSTVMITVAAKDQFGNPVSGQSVILSASGSQNIFVQPAPTDASGQTTGTLASTEAETKTISATVSGTAVTQTASVTFSAVPVITHTITASAGANGSISPSGAVAVNDGVDQAFALASDAHYHIADVVVDGSSVGATTSYMFISIKTDHTISATFATTTRTLSYAAGNHGTLTGTSTQIVNDGESGTAVTAVADAGYHFENWSDGSAANPRTDANVTGDISVTALFALNPDTVPPVISLNGSATTSVALGNVFMDPGATAVDDVDGTITPVVTGAVDTSTPGAYALTYTATDSHGNASSKIRTVIVSGISLVVVTALNGDGTQSGILTNAATSTINTSAGTMSVAVPANLFITGSSGWNGTIYLPTATATLVAPTPDSGDAADAVASIEIGFGDIALTFDKAVKILFAGQAGKLVGWSQAGAFHRITTVCGGAEDQAWADANLAAAQDCKFDSGSDLVVWTKHFTVFTVYTQNAIPQSGGGSGSGGGSISSGGGGGSSGGGDSGGGILVQNTGSGGTNSGAPAALPNTPVLVAVIPVTAAPSIAVTEKTNPVAKVLSRTNQTHVAKTVLSEQTAAPKTGIPAGNVAVPSQTVSLLAAIGGGITLGTGSVIVGVVVLLALFGGGAFLVRKRWFI